jgi:hypothetical protein
MGKSQTLPDYPRGLTFEDVWAALMEERERQKEEREQQKERFRKWDEQYEKDAQEWRKRHAETERVVKETAKKIGDLGDRFGEMIEHMVMPALVEKFRELGFVFTDASPRRIIDDEKNNILTEVDIILENDDKVMIIEVKSKLSSDDVTDHIKRMEIVRTRARRRNDNRIFLGAVAGMVVDKSIKIFALRKGFYVIEPSGEEFAITVPEGGYSPREW